MTNPVDCDGFPQVIPPLGVSVVHVVAGQAERH